MDSQPANISANASNKPTITRPRSRARVKPWQKILIGLGLGAIMGILLGEKSLYLKPFGDIFINAIMMVVVPVVFTSLVTGIISMDNPAKMGRVGIKTLSFYFVTMGLATTIGLTLAIFAQPGMNISLTLPQTMEVAEATSLREMMVAIVPSNPVMAFAEGNILQIIVFAILLGIAINLVGEPARPAANLFRAFSEISFKLINMIMYFAPYGVFALMAWAVGTHGTQVLMQLMGIVVLIYVGCLINMLLTYGGALTVLARLNPIPFFKGMVDAQAVAFSTTSSTAAMPVAMQCAEKNLGVPKSFSSLIFPLGATMNMNGLSVYMGVVAVFAANVFGVELSIMQYATIILTSVLASLGAAGVPGAGLIVMSIVLTSAGLPLSIIAIIAGVDRIIDMATTTTNMTGDALVSVIVSKSEGELDLDIYNGRTQK